MESSRRATLGVVILACTAVTSCKRRPSILADTPPVAASAEPTPSGASMRSAPAASTIAPVPRARIGLEVTEGTAVTRQIYLVSAQLGLRERIAEPRDPYWCTAELETMVRPDPPDSCRAQPFYHESGVDEARMLVLTCLSDKASRDFADTVVASVQNDTKLVLLTPGGGRREIALPGGADLDVTLPPPPPRPGPCRASKLRAFTEKAPDTGFVHAPPMRLRIPGLSVLVPWGLSERAGRCSSRSYPVAQRHEVLCSQEEGVATLHASVRGDLLVIDETLAGYPCSPHRLPRGALVLACGTSVSFDDFSFPDAALLHRDHPGCVCNDQWDVCDRRCFATSSDGDGTLTEAGRGCAYRCRATMERCESAAVCLQGALAPHCDCSKPVPWR